MKVGFSQGAYYKQSPIAQCILKAHNVMVSKRRLRRTEKLHLSERFQIKNSEKKSKQIHQPILSDKKTFFIV